MDTAEPTLADRVAAASWYHTFDLPGGITTPGLYDLRAIADKVLPADLSGRRCLDAAMSSGFWAFEMEKRGASEVVGVDLEEYGSKDWQYPWAAPSGEESQLAAFTIAKQALGSQVERRHVNLYDVGPDRLGTFDFVFIGSVLLHLRDPVRALRALRTVTSGELLSFEPVLFWTSLIRPGRAVGQLYQGFESRWWTPSVAAHQQWLRAAGFDLVDSGRFVRQPFGALLRSRSGGKSLSALKHRLGPGTFGVPSAWVLARPRGE